MLFVKKPCRISLAGLQLGPSLNSPFATPIHVASHHIPLAEIAPPSELGKLVDGITTLHRETQIEDASF